MINQMLRYVIDTFYNDIYVKYPNQSSDNTQYESMIIEFYSEVVRRTAVLVSQWMSVGWTHGVLNTDNMSILGLTLDYGPYGFQERFHFSHTPNASDKGSRYCYSAQPEICKWNCLKLAEALTLAVPYPKLYEALQSTYDTTYNQSYLSIFRNKLGLISSNNDSDRELIDSLFDTMDKTGADFTNTFRRLSRVQCNVSNEKEDGVLDYMLTQCATIDALKQSVHSKLNLQQLQTLSMLIQTQPEVLNELGGDAAIVINEMNKLKKQQELESMTDQQLQHDNRELWSIWLAKYRDRLQVDARHAADANNLSIQQITNQRIIIQNKTNPRYVLRNNLAQNAIDAAEHDDYNECQRLFNVLMDPYDQLNDTQQITTGVIDENKSAEICNMKSLNQYDKQGKEIQYSCSS